MKFQPGQRVRLFVWLAQTEVSGTVEEVHADGVLITWDDIPGVRYTFPVERAHKLKLIP